MPGEPILIVDDTPVNLKLTRMLLEHEGFNVRTAASAEDALGVLETFHPRLVLADIQLPGIDGLEMTRRIKADSRNHDVLVIALTAYAMKGDEEKAMQAGCDGYITKPIDTRTLGDRLRAHLDQAPTPLADGLPEPLLPDEEMRELQERFLSEGLRLVRQWNGELFGAFDVGVASTVAHQWAGSGGLLGFPRISELAREVEQALRQPPLDTGQFRDVLESLESEFRTPTRAETMLETSPEPEPPIQARVLIADSDPNMPALLKALLETQAIECHTITDGAAVLESIRRTTPQAVVLDGNMPGMTVCQVLQGLREDRLPVKVLLLTTQEHPAEMADDYLMKPFNPIDVVVRLKKLL